VRGYKEEGTTTTPFDMTVLNELDRFHLAGAAIDRIAGLQNIAAYAHQDIRKCLIAHTEYVREHGEDMPEIGNWKWPGIKAPAARVLLHAADS
jgi:xylulose-5-phosphate/fructose-6-phosphate phosphoketolase